jgi:hypothetical protein
MTSDGIAAISEISWFTHQIPQPVLDFWQEAYPQIASESDNSKLARTCGFEVLGVHRLPTQAWWTHYYDPLKKRMDALRPSADSVMQEVISETEFEIEFFAKYSDCYGYTFYLLQAA